jgi:hypothetical protein
LVPGQGIWGWDGVLGFEWVRKQFESSSRRVGYGMGFWVGKVSIWLRVKVYGARDGVWGK